MAILYDARGNEWLGAVDQVGNGTLTDARDADAVLGALNAEIVMDLSGHDTALFDVRTAAGNLTVVFEGTLDGTNYFALVARTVSGLLAATASSDVYVANYVIASTCASLFAVKVAGMRRVRVRCSAYTSGNVTVTGRASMASDVVVTRYIPSTLHVTATAAANTLATATLPAAGAGLYHYITNINLMRNATAALAGTATLIHTTTNLPGNPAWSVGNAMVAGGTQLDLDFTPTTPLKSSVPNTATTVVMPAAGAAVLNRINVTYYIGI